MITQQGNEEDDESCMKQINMRVDALKLVGGGHVISSPNIVIKAPASKEKDSETQKFIVVLFTMNSDSGINGSLNRNLAHESQLGNNNYHMLLSSTHELLSRHSSRYETNGGRG